MMGSVASNSSTGCGPYATVVEELRIIRRQLAMKQREAERAETLRRHREIADLPLEFEFPAPDEEQNEADTTEASSTLWDDAAESSKEQAIDWNSFGRSAGRSKPSGSSNSSARAQLSKSGSPSKSAVSQPSLTSSAASKSSSKASSSAGATMADSQKKDERPTKSALAKSALRRALAGRAEEVLVHKRGKGIGGDGGSDADSDKGEMVETYGGQKVRWADTVAGGGGAPGDQEVRVRSVLHGGPLAGKQATASFMSGYWAAGDAGGWDMDDEESGSGSGAASIGTPSAIG